MEPSPADVDLSAPPTALLIDPLETACVVLPAFPIPQVLGASTRPQIAAAVVETITVYVVNDNPIRRIAEKAMHKHTPTINLCRRVTQVIGYVARTHDIPPLRRDALIIRIVHNNRTAKYL
jgi:hypothetical protein